MAEPIVPDWLTADFLKSCLESDKENFKNITIVDHTIKPAVAAGNNYGSYMFRVNINYRKEREDKEYSISIIVKTPITSYMEKMKDLASDFYKIEPRFYNEFINETYKLCNHSIVPKHFTSPNPLCVVLEDLSTVGYKMADRHELLDFEHCQLYTKASAKLHALSVAVHKKNPKLIETLGLYKVELPEIYQKMFKAIVNGGFQCMSAYLEDKPQLKDYFDIITDAAVDDKFYKIYQEMEEAETPIRALTQGDPWCTNMMFRYNSYGEVVGIKLLDFQTLRFSSPVKEFITFVWASARPEIRENRLNDLYHLYCDSLNAGLEELDCPERLSFEELMDQINLHSPQVLMAVCMMVPICLADEPADMNDFMTGHETNVPVKERPIYKLYQSSTFNKFYPQILHQLQKEGVFTFVKEKLQSVKI